MMSLDSISKRVWFRGICSLGTIMAYVVVSLLPIGVAAQVTRDSPVLTPGLHNLELPRADEPAIHYAISIPAPVETSFRFSLVRRSRNSRPLSSRRIRCAVIGAAPRTRRQ